MKLNWHLLEEKILDKSSKNFWLLLGPLSLLLTFLLLHCRSSLSLSLLSMTSVVGYYLCWKFSFKGLFLSLAFMASALLGLFLSTPASLGLWQMFWALSLCITLSLIAFSSDEYEKAKLREDENFQKKLSDVDSLHKKELESFSDLCDMHLGENNELKTKLELLSEKIHSYKQLAVASKEESDKYFSESEQLSEKVQSLQIEISKSRELAFDEKIRERLVKKQRKQLNDVRVQNYQNKLLIDDYRKKELNHSQNVTTPSSSFNHDESLEKLSMLEVEREDLKVSYLEKMRSYEAIKEKFKTFFTMDEMLAFQDPESSFENKYNELKLQFEELGQHLSELRFDIFKVEGQILQIKNSMPKGEEEGSFQSYLTIADQECLRLEKENQVLIDLLSQNLIFSQKKNSTDK